MARSTASSSYLWMSARALNALRRAAIMGIVGGLVFVSALIAFVLVPRQASKAAIAVAASLEEKVDTSGSVSIRNGALARIAAADSMLAVARRTVAPAPAPVVDTFPPYLIAQRETIAVVASGP